VSERFVLKEGEVYLVSDSNGDIASRNSEGHGLYWRDTRFLSLYELRIDGTTPTLLSAAGEHSFMNNLQFANAQLTTRDGRELGPRTLSVRRNRFIHGGLQERIGLFNYNRFPVVLQVTLALGSDFRDMFDVRGYTQRAVHGVIETPEVVGPLVRLRYQGLDGVPRSTVVEFSRAPDEVLLENLDLPDRVQRRDLPGLSGHGDLRTEYAITPPSALARFELLLEPMQAASITVHVLPSIREQSPDRTLEPASLDDKFVLIRNSYRAWEAQATEYTTDHDVLNSAIRRASGDLRLLSEPCEDGYLPSAGIPWFSVPFGRDGLITGLQTLAFEPRLARGTLHFLADHQGRRVDNWRDEEPGKILHEVRMGEVASLGQVPHTPYYGSVDSTPLFLVALGEYLRWSGDLTFAASLRPAVEAALDWIDIYGDRDGDGYVEYHSRSEHGIRNQGWKDSYDAVAYPDGRLVEPPIALAEVQGYVYAARLAAASLFRRLGLTGRAALETERAAALKERFWRDFLLPDEQYYAMVLTPDKAPLPVIGSNPGHCLWSGLLEGEAGRLAARRLQRADLDCGWGIRTLSSQEPMFNPMSYHNGSVWPHDNALIAAGLKRLGEDRAATHLIGEVLEAAMRFPDQRLPELFCGFTRDQRYFSIPAQYPVSCSPQAWSAGAIFLMLQTLLGLEADAERNRLTLRPSLPSWLDRLSVRRLRVGSRRVDFLVFREAGRLRVEVTDAGGLDLEVKQAGD
jgi:glycogen debranching enzyme